MPRVPCGGCGRTPPGWASIPTGSWRPVDQRAAISLLAQPWPQDWMLKEKMRRYPQSPMLWCCSTRYFRFDNLPQQLQRMVEQDEAVAKAISPTLYLTKDTPPTLLFYGSADRLAAQGEEFMKKSKELGHRAELFTAEGQGPRFLQPAAVVGKDDAEDGRVPGVD